VICWQEHKLQGNKLTTLSRVAWPRGGYYAQEAALGYRHDNNDLGAGCGGVCMWISPKLTHLVSSSGHSRSGRAQWIRLSGVPGGDVAFLNVYAHSSSQRDCIELWTELLETLPQDCRWLLAGDWNTVENEGDKSSSSGRLMGVNERRVFDQLKVALGVEDIFPASNVLRFSWDNQQQGANRKMAGLDRIYAFQRSGAGNAVTEYKILRDCCHNDHLPV
jgi:exonuclease III